MSFSKCFIFMVFLGVCTFLCGCKVEPLYRQVSKNATLTGNVAGQDVASLGLSARLASIVVEEPSDRFGQMVRNHLLFLLYGNGDKPSAPAYQLALQISVFTRNSMQIEVDFDKRRNGRPSVGTVIGKVSYSLRNMDNVPLATGMATMRASFERLRQEYATLQAEEDAQKRVAEELAEQIFMLLSRDLLKEIPQH
ncbi:LPS assembly lipoprotein LptE [Bartonella raoultii]|uniref:LPS-assembly lipoprotein n=1 Tax=Bartonella raoultii TaxID=1457020 RepID=A0ABS7I631_9HYPH|nr:LPS assembly lipoprotein LptE [Bartonella raoultii]MBX4335875.1 hypothetical protein [Bartonella raoultii]